MLTLQEREYEKAIGNTTSLQIETAHASLITHITKYLTFFKRLTEMDESTESKYAFLNFQAFNKNLSDISVKEQLEKLSKDLHFCNENENLKATISCIYGKETVGFYLFETIFVILDSEKKVLAKMKVSNTELFIYNKVMFIVSDQYTTTYIKSKPI